MSKQQSGKEQEQQDDAARAAAEGQSEEQKENAAQELQKKIDAATGQTPSRVLVRHDPGQILAELTDHIEKSGQAQDAEIARNTALLDDVRGQRAGYKVWIAQINELDQNAEAAEKEILAALQATHFARALLSVQRIK